jgi:hypothetical protein
VWALDVIFSTQHNKVEHKNLILLGALSCLVEEKEKDIRLQLIRERKNLEKIDTRTKNKLSRQS